MTTRRDLLNQHDNNYGFSVSEELKKPLLNTTDLPSISIIIPYYETGEIFSRCLYFLRAAVREYEGKTEIIVVDDGSKQRPLLDYLPENIDSTIVPVILPENQGRTAARNAGLDAATGKIYFFLDSDVLVDQNIIVDHAKLHIAAEARQKHAICVSFFEFTDKKSPKIFKDSLVPRDIQLNDFRIECTYGPTWIGCEEDKQFIGEHMKLVENTDHFKKWRGQYKAWMLPNMILGGAFSVEATEIQAVGGFDVRFIGYGFTETSAVTRMVAERDNVVIPRSIGGALHVEDETVNVPREDKDVIFQKKHDFYFNTFLMENAQ